jgi:hypothetical protein
MPLAQPVYLLSDLTLTLSSGVVSDKLELQIETNPEITDRVTGKKGAQIATHEKPPRIMLKVPMTSALHFETFATFEAVGTFTLTSDNDTDADVIATLQTDWPVNKWAWGKKSMTLNNTGDTELNIEILTNLLNPTA